MVFDPSGHIIDEDRAKGYTGYFVNPGDMGVWPFKNSSAQKSRGGKYQGQEADATGNKTGYSFVSQKPRLTWTQLKERWQKKRAERATKKQQQAQPTPAQPEQQALARPEPQAGAVPPTQDEIIKGTNYGMNAGVPYENKNGEKRVLVPSQNNDPAKANIGGGVAKGVANRETAKQAAQAPAYQPSSEKEAQFYARAQMNKAAQQNAVPYNTQLYNQYIEAGYTPEQAKEMAVRQQAYTQQQQTKVEQQNQAQRDRLAAQQAKRDADSVMYQ